MSLVCLAMHTHVNILLTIDLHNELICGDTVFLIQELLVILDEREIENDIVENAARITQLLLSLIHLKERYMRTQAVL